MQLVRAFIVALLCCLSSAGVYGALSGLVIPAPPAACSDVAPSQAAAFGITQCVFKDGPFSLTTIDTTDTSSCSGGCKWYTHNAWPNMSPSGIHWSTLPTATATPSSDYSISSNNLVLAASGTYGEFPGGTYGVVAMLNTCKASGGTYIGNAFSGPFYVEVNASYGGSPGGFDPNTMFWPIMWLVPTEALTAGSTIQFVEADVFESAFGQFFHNWNTFSAGDDTNHGQASVDSFPIGLLVVPQANNPLGDGGVSGIAYRYGNNVQTTAASLTFGTGISPTYGGSSTSDPIGTFSTLNTHHYCLMLAGLSSWPLTVSSIKVWQKP